MRQDEKTAEGRLDAAIQELRKDRLSPEQALEASDKVWNQITQQEKESRITGCLDLQSLIPAYLEGQLSENRTLLLEDHVQNCVSCRKVLTQARSEKRVLRSFEPRSDRMSFWMKWGAVAAGILVVFGLFQTGALDQFNPWEGSSVASLRNLEGKVFQVLEEGIRLVERDQSIQSRQPVRTAKDSAAIVVLSDGSRIEMGERTELAILDGWFGTTIQLRRGNVIVEAVPQGVANLYVSTEECRVAVKGTVFSVSHGMKGSRVSVIEGEVLVERGNLNTTLRSGEQFGSQPDLSKVSVQEDIAWSRSAEEYLSLLDEFSTLREDLQEATFGEELRYSSELLDLLPQNTVVYGAVPNVSGRLRDVYELFLERVEENDVLRQWYTENFQGDEGITLGELVEQLTKFGDYLGEEVVFALVQLAEGSTAPVVLARTTDEELFWMIANEEAARINSLADGESGIFIVDDVASVNATTGLFVLIRDGLAVASPSTELLETIGSRSPSAFLESRFYQTIAARYAEGVDWLLSLDLGMLRREPTSDGMERLGFSQLHDLVFERKLNPDGIAENRAVLSYEGGQEGGIISWIADPGPIGAMEYVSPEAYLAAAFVVSDPGLMVESLLNRFVADDASALTALEQFEVEHNISIVDDIAAPLGGEVLFAVDGPVLPEPSWKVVLEVYDPQTLQHTIGRFVEEVNRVVVQEGGVGIEMITDSSGSLTIHSIKKADSSVSFEYAYLNGYMLIAPDRSLIYNAVQSQEARYTLASSADFLNALPRDGSVNFSGVFYQNMAPMAEAVLSSPVGDSVKVLLNEATPMLLLLSAEPGQLTLSSGGDLESFWLNLGIVASLGGPDGIANILGSAVQDH